MSVSCDTSAHLPTIPRIALSLSLPALHDACCRRILRSSSVVGRQPARRHVEATEVATEGT